MIITSFIRNNFKELYEKDNTERNIGYSEFENVILTGRPISKHAVLTNSHLMSAVNIDFRLGVQPSLDSLITYGSKRIAKHNRTHIYIYMYAT
jgi:hypothetical protein